MTNQKVWPFPRAFTAFPGGMVNVPRKPSKETALAREWILKQEEITGPDGTTYSARREVKDGGFIVTVTASSAPDAERQAIPMTLAWRAKLWNGLFATWPPQSFEKIFWEQGRLKLIFRDPWYPYDKKPLLPFGLDIDPNGWAPMCPASAGNSSGCA